MRQGNRNQQHAIMSPIPEGEFYRGHERQTKSSSIDHVRIRCGTRPQNFDRFDAGNHEVVTCLKGNIFLPQLISVRNDGLANRIPGTDAAAAVQRKRCCDVIATVAEDIHVSEESGLDVRITDFQSSIWQDVQRKLMRRQGHSCGIIAYRRDDTTCRNECRHICTSSRS